MSLCRRATIALQAQHPLLAVPLVRLDRPLEQQVRAARAAGADVIELRVDLLRDVAAVERLLRSCPDTPFILTVRSAAEGGAWAGDEADRLATIERLAKLHPGLVDVEAGVDPLPRLYDNALILSRHCFDAPPGDFAAAIDELSARGPHVVKLAAMLEDSADAWRLLAALRDRAPRTRLVAVGMGPAGLATRVLCRKLGGFLTFASLTAEAASAPGQPTVADLIGLYRWPAIGSATRVFGVVGWPVGHSRSPHVHNAAMAGLGIDGVYLPLPVQPQQAAFFRFMDTLETAPWLDVGGLSVTVPHKQHALSWLRRRGGRVSDRAARCGAVNTLTRGPDGRWSGENTDIIGIRAALREVLPPDATADVLGAGGVARAVVVALQEMGCPVTLYNRTPRRARELAGELGCQWAPWERRSAGQGGLLVNCTTIGMQDEELPVGPERLTPPLVVFDCVYTPPMTALLRAAARRGCRIVSGQEMFIHQAAAQFALWHHQPAPLAAMRAALGNAL